MSIFAGDSEIAAHPFGERLDDGEAQSRAAVAARDLGVRLREWAEQTLDLGGFEANAAVGDSKEKAHASARHPRAAHIKPHRAAFGELHRIVEEIFQRRPQPHRIADQHLRQRLGHHHFGG